MPRIAAAMLGLLLVIGSGALVEPAVAQQQLAREQAEARERADAERRAPTGPSSEGIPVPKRSRVASLASSERLEGEASVQYRTLLERARAQRALAPVDHPQRQRLVQIARRLVPYTHRFSDRSDDWRWEVNLIGSSQVNAFVMPGGKIVFFSGILDALDLTDDEVAMVMGHEMAHALLEHARERSGQQTVAQGLTLGASVLSQVLGYGDLGGMLVQGASKVTLLGFSRGDETEADLVGMDIAARAGYDPRAAVSLWQKMAAKSKGQPPQWASTHPSHSTRITTLQQAQPKVIPLYERARTARDTAAQDSTAPRTSP